MTLDQSLANLEYQATRLANLFASTADAIETARAPQLRIDPAIAAGEIVEAAGYAIRFDPNSTTANPPLPQQPAVDWQATPPEKLEELSRVRDEAVASMAAEAQIPPHVWPNTPQGAAPSSAPPVAAFPASAVEVEGPGVGAPETPRPAGPAPEKKSGRRTNEELAAEIGVNLEDVKKWKGGGRISKNDMEEFRRLFPQAVAQPAAAVPAQASSPFGGPAEPMPVTPQAPPVPQQAAPVTPQPQAVPQSAPAVPPANEWPVAQPVAAAQAAPGEQFEDWQTAANPWGADGDPFGG